MNRRQEGVSYRPFQISPVLQQGLLPIERDNGDLYRRVASGLARLADDQIQKAAQEAEIAGAKAGALAGLEGAPTAQTIEGGDVTGTASVNGQAGHIRGAQGVDPKGVRVTVPPAQIRGLLTDAAKRNGVNPDALMEVARLESGFDPNANNPNSTAGGLLQFIDSTARQYGLRNKFDAGESAEAGARLMADNTRYLAGRLGRTPTAGELYLAHQQGPGGAAKLLSNPDAKAVDIVGADAVRLNGGTADMTAGQFANLWISKVHASATNILPETLDGPIRVTPVVSPIKIIPGQPGNFRPRGDNSIYSRSYDVAGTRTWLQLAKQTIEQEQTQLYDQYKDDPAKLQAAYGQLLEDHKRRGIFFDEVAPEYVSSFKESAFNFTRAAQTEQIKKQEQIDQVQFLDRIGEAENRKSQLMAGLDPKDDHASAMLADAQDTIDSHYDSAVNRGVMTPLEAANAKRQSRSGMVVDYYTKQAAGLNTADAQKLQADMTADYAAGKLSGVTAEDWGKISDGLTSIVAKRQTMDKTADAALTARGDDIFARTLRGEQVAASDMATLRTDAMTAPNGEKILASTDARMRLATALRTQPITAVEANLNEIMKTGDKATAEDITFARTQIEEARKKLAVDPLGLAEQYGIVPATPPVIMDGQTDPAKLRDALAYRRGAAVAAAEHFGVPVKFFRPGEADQLQAQAMQNPDAMVAFALNASQAFGKDTPAALKELSESGPVMAHAVGLSIATGDPSIARDVARITQMKAKKEITIKMPEAGTLAIKSAQYLSGALLAKPDMQNAVTQTAGLLFEKMATERGLDPGEIKTPGSPEEAAYFEALDRALGGQTFNDEKTGGLGEMNGRQIIVPAMMPKDRVEALVYGMTSDQLKMLPPLGTFNGVPIDPDRIKGGYLVTVGDGLYRVTMNDPDSAEPDYLISPDGRPWVLDIRALEKAGKQGKADTFGYMPQGAQ